MVALQDCRLHTAINAHCSEATARLSCLAKLEGYYTVSQRNKHVPGAAPPKRAVSREPGSNSVLN
jgi:hypothetical protein